jgi:hypothetical protein
MFALHYQKLQWQWRQSNDFIGYHQSLSTYIIYWTTVLNSLYIFHFTDLACKLLIKQKPQGFRGIGSNVELVEGEHYIRRAPFLLKRHFPHCFILKMGILRVTWRGRWGTYLSAPWFLPTSVKAYHLYV